MKNKKVNISQAEIEAAAMKGQQTVEQAIEPMNKKGLARILGVSTFILSKMLKSCKAELGEPIGTMYCVKQVQYMINKFGLLKK